MKEEIKTIPDHVEAVKTGRIDAVDVIRGELANVKEYNQQLNAFITIFEEETAFALSKFHPRSINKDRLNDFPLSGVPLTVKDNIFVEGYRTTAASAVFQEFIPAVNADVFDRGLSAGCIPLGKTNLHELAMGATSSSSFFGPVRNPVDSTRVSGGSSGGSAVSVARSKIPMISLGTDTGGSVRIPAALCGVCGFKPTFDLISTTGVLPLSATLDHVGIITKNMTDMRFAFGALAGQNRDFRGSLHQRASKFKIGIPGRYFFEDCAPEVEKAFWRAINAMRGGEVEVVEDIEIPGFERISKTRVTIQVAEAYWFYQDLVNDSEKRKLVGKDVMSFFDQGSKVSEMEHLVCSRERINLMSNISATFQKVDFIAMPTCLATAPKLEDVLGKEAGSIRRQLVRNTELFNVCGLPSLTMPTNEPGSGELPTAIELSGRAFGDDELIEAGEKIWNLIH